MKNNPFSLFSDRPLLCLVFFCLVFYILENYSLRCSSTTTPSSSEHLYIEVAKPDEFPVIIKLNNVELEQIASLYNIPRKLRNGDKLIINNKGAATSFSRISGRKSLALGVPIGINSAGIDDLVVLPGIGTKLAERVIEYRESHKGFKSIHQLYNIKGIGQKKVEAIRTLISLD
jgi:competence protein ComEA